MLDLNETVSHLMTRKKPHNLKMGFSFEETMLHQGHVTHPEICYSTLIESEQNHKKLECEWLSSCKWHNQTCKQKCQPSTNMNYFDVIQRITIFLGLASDRELKSIPPVCS